MTSAELYQAGRYAWVLGAQADGEAYALVVYNNTVLQAVEIESLEDVVVTDKAPPSTTSTKGPPPGPTTRYPTTHP